MQKTRLRKYAKLIARVGANVQPSQDVFLYAGLDQPEFVAMVTEEIYKAGARRVFVKFDYQPPPERAFSPNQPPGQPLRRV